MLSTMLSWTALSQDYNAVIIKTAGNSSHEKFILFTEMPTLSVETSQGVSTLWISTVKANVSICPLSDVVSITAGYYNDETAKLHVVSTNDPSSDTYYDLSGKIVANPTPGRVYVLSSSEGSKLIQCK